MVLHGRVDGFNPCRALIAWWLLALPVHAQIVTQIQWRTSSAAAPVVLNAQQRQWLPLFQSALRWVPEETMVAMSLSQGTLPGVEAKDAARLQNLFSNYYARVRAAAPFRQAPSALPYCFSDTKPTNGLATVYLPARITPETRELIFLHGYGGSLLAYLHYLATLFPDAVILCPAYGIAPANVPAGYIFEAHAATQGWTKTLKTKPVLVGLSAGGVGACRVYAQSPGRFRQLICLGSVPPADALERFARTARACFVAGGAEPYVADKSFERTMRWLQGRAADVRWRTIPKADHYFMLSHESQTRQFLRESCAQ